MSEEARLIPRNLFSAVPDEKPEETFETLLHGGAFRLEHIVSRGQASAEGFWYDQDKPEWVMLARGAALLEFDGHPPLELRAGDCLLIPVRVRHRVKHCSQDAIWLALHFMNRQ